MENRHPNIFHFKTMIDTPRQKRINTMAQIVMCIAEHYHVDPKWIIDMEPRKNIKVMSARRILVFHLYDCGMSFEKIAAFLKRDISTVRDYYTFGKQIVLNGMRDFVDELPRVTSTLFITQKTP